jgi:hypothetical protein
MTLNKDVFLKDPTDRQIPNLGVAKVEQPETTEEWEVLRYELESFVCEGEYASGLERILSTYLRNLGQPQQPAAWVSGFYGSGKSHLVRVLQYLWADQVLPDGVAASDLVSLPTPIKDALKELRTVSKRSGGAWSAAGTLGAGASDRPRLAFLSTVLRGAGLPGGVAPARFVLWLDREGALDKVKSHVAAQDREWAIELSNMYVSPILADALLTAMPDFAADSKTAKEALREQFRPVDDISNEDMLEVFGEVLTMRSDKQGKIPCTLVVLDELQQYINNELDRMLAVQGIVEACSAKFESQVLFVATGQSALQSTDVLRKLQGRFTVVVSLQDTDVESVVRNVVLQKAPDKKDELRAALERVSGEIDKELAGTKIGPTQGDSPRLIADYPILPARQRFWERALRAVDRGGTAGQLRTQLRMSLDAVKLVAEDPLGNVVPADFLYDSQADGMLQSGVLLRDTYTKIESLRERGADGELKARLCSLIFLISQLPLDAGSDIGVRATPEMLVDLLVTDLNAGGSALRKQVPSLLQELTKDGAITEIGGGEYRLLTKEGSEWQRDYSIRLGQALGDTSRIASERDQAIRAAIAGLERIPLLQGTSKTPRKVALHFGPAQPGVAEGRVPIWIRDGWDCTDKAMRDDAFAAGTDSPIVFVWLPKTDGKDLAQAIAERVAAADTAALHAPPTTEEGRQARDGMEAKKAGADRRVQELVRRLVQGAKVFQGGGNEIEPSTLEAAAQTAAEASMDRLFPQFLDADSGDWSKVAQRARDGSADVLGVVGFKGDPLDHPVCKEVLGYVSASGTKGGDARKRFMAPPYGWPQDAVDGALLALGSVNALSARQNGVEVAIKEVSTGKVSTTTFYREANPPQASQRIQVRKFLQECGQAVQGGEEALGLGRVLDELLVLASDAGGEPPKPEAPDTSDLKELANQPGNTRIVQAFERLDELRAQRQEWTRRRDGIALRLPKWQQLQSLLSHAAGLSEATEIRYQAEAVHAGRQLLDDPDPVEPLLTKTAAILREAVSRAAAGARSEYDGAMSTLAASDEWSQLSDADKVAFADQVGLTKPAEPDLGTAEALVTALEQVPLTAWRDKAEAMPERANRARMLAVKTAEPQAVSFTPPKAHLKSQDDVDEYLEALRVALLRAIEDGTVII